MKKKFRRGERKALLKRINVLEDRVKEIRQIKNELERRLMVAGTEVETVEESIGPVQIIRAEPKAYGDYMYFTRPFKEEDLEYMKNKLAINIAKGLLDLNIIQYISRREQFSPLEYGATVGAKLFVIPWEEMRTRKLEIKKQLK